MPALVLFATFSVCDAPPPDRDALLQCAFESAKEWIARKPASRDIATLALEAAATDDPAKLRGIVADLVGYLVYQSQHSQPTGAPQCPSSADSTTQPKK